MDAHLPLTAFATINRGPVELVEFFLLYKKDEVLKPSQEVGQVHPREGEHEGSNVNNAVDPPLLRVMMERNIDLLQPFLTFWPDAIALLFEPKNIPHTVQLLFQISDELCEASGVKASRLDWYTERGSVLALLCCTELYMLSDDSEDYRDTR